MMNKAALLKAKMRALIHALNTTDLCIEWNLSSVKWNAATNQGKLDIALIRDFMLEEFEQRDPKAYRAWFEDDDPSDDPSRFYKSNEPSKFKKPEKRINGMSKSDRWHWQNDSYPN